MSIMSTMQGATAAAQQIAAMPPGPARDAAGAIVGYLPLYSTIS